MSAEMKSGDGGRKVVLSISDHLKPRNAMMALEKKFHGYERHVGR